jgi:hypothetical protein
VKKLIRYIKEVKQELLILNFDVRKAYVIFNILKENFRKNVIRELIGYESRNRN